MLSAQTLRASLIGQGTKHFEQMIDLVFGPGQQAQTKPYPVGPSNQNEVYTLGHQPDTETLHAL